MTGSREVSLPLPGKKPMKLLAPEGFIKVPAVKPSTSALLLKSRLLPPLRTTALRSRPPSGTVEVAVTLRFWVAAAAEAAGRAVAATLS